MGLIVGSWDQVIGTFNLLGGKGIRIVDRGRGCAEKGHERSDLALEVIIEDLDTLHGFVEGLTGNIPATKGGGPWGERHR